MTIEDIRINLRGGGFTEEEIDQLLKKNRGNEERLIGKKSQSFIESLNTNPQ